MTDKYTQIAAYVNGYRDYFRIQRLINAFLKRELKVAITGYTYENAVRVVGEDGNTVNPPLYIGFDYEDCLNWILNRRHRPVDPVHPQVTDKYAPDPEILKRVQQFADDFNGDKPD